MADAEIDTDTDVGTGGLDLRPGARDRYVCHDDLYPEGSLRRHAGRLAAVSGAAPAAARASRPGRHAGRKSHRDGVGPDRRPGRPAHRSAGGIDTGAHDAGRKDRLSGRRRFVLRARRSPSRPAGVPDGRWPVRRPQRGSLDHLRGGHRAGGLLGSRSREPRGRRGVHIMLAPGVNIYRAPMCGRNFEYFGEDPFLAARMAVSYIEGMQAQGVSATIKHFIGNNSEIDRHHTSSEIDERTLREIYLPAFEAAVKEAHVGALMTSYNLVDGVHMTENAALVDGLL